MNGFNFSIAHTLPGRTFSTQPKPVKEYAQFSVSGVEKVVNEKCPTARLNYKER